jgi:hypothetical protein
MRGLVVPLALAVAACSSKGNESSPGIYSVQFPSTAAAVATDFVQILVFDVTPENREQICGDLVRGRTRGDELRPSVNPPSPSANICEMLAGRKPVTIPYGEKALLAIAQRKTNTGAIEDLLIGCAVMTIGEGDAPAPIPLHLVTISQPIPPTECGSVQEYCADQCR